MQETEYFHLRGQAGRENIEAIIRKNNSTILYNINGSKIYTFDGEPIKFEHKISIHDGDDATLILTSDSESFPKKYWFLEKAVFAWLKKIYDQIETN